MNNNENTQVVESSKWKNIWRFFGKIPKVVKYVIIFSLLIALSSGVIYSTVFESQTKTTKLGFEDMGELVTQTGYLTIIKDNKEHREFFNLFKIPFTESRQIFSYDIEVDASVDFSKISYDVKNKDKEIIIKLPHSKIYKATLDIDSLKVYLDDESLFSRIDLKEHNEALNEMKQQGINDAIANGILDSADNNAKKLIDSFIRSNNKYKDHKIVYEYIGG